jgi:hypothetical protein
MGSGVSRQKLDTSSASASTGRVVKTALGLKSNKGEVEWSKRYMQPGNFSLRGSASWNDKKNRPPEDYLILVSKGSRTLSAYNSQLGQRDYSNRILYQIPIDILSDDPQEAVDTINNDPKIIELKKYYNIPPLDISILTSESSGGKRRKKIKRKSTRKVYRKK